MSNGEPQQTKNIVTQVTRTIREEEQKTRERLRKKQESAGQRFPLLFMLLGAFGLVATFYGFEHIIDRIALLKNNPEYMLITGVVVLILTGSLYRKLG